MRKTFLLISFLVVVQFATAQFNLGIKAGMTVANQRDAYYGFAVTGTSIMGKYFDGKSITGFHAGVFTDVRLGKDFIFRPQINYSKEGFEIPQLIDFSGNLVGGHIKILLNYINMPLQLLYSPSLSFGKPWIGFGPYGGLLLSGKVKSSDNSSSVKIGNSQDDDFKQFDFGICSSLGFALNNGIFIGADYNLGLVKVAPYDGKNKNFLWSFYLGYKLRFNK